MSQRESSNGRHRRRIRGSKEGGNKRGGAESWGGKKGVKGRDRQTDIQRQREIEVGGGEEKY